MRLQPEEVSAIKESAAAVFGEAATVRLFGSRADDSRRGGDIDLHVEVPPGRARWADEAAMILRIQDAIGEQRIDVVLHERGAPLRPIDRIALDTGVVL